MSSKIPGYFGLFSLLFLLAAAPQARAAWPQHPAQNLPITTSPLDQRNPVTISDGAGGMIVAWIDSTNGVSADVHVQRIGVGGDLLWGANGIVACAAEGRQDEIALASDGGNGAIVSWSDYRPGTLAGDLYAQHIDGEGNVQWLADGALVSGAVNGQQGAKSVADGAGGAFFVWIDGRNFVANVYAQRVNSAGEPQWPGDVRITGYTCGGNCTVLNPQLIADGTGGVIAAWVDGRVPDFFQLDIYAQRINSDGNALWGTDGAPVCTAPSVQVHPALISDGLGGAIVAWLDARNGVFTESSIQAQRVDANGTAQWTHNGVELRTTLGISQYPKLVSDQAGGAIVTWNDLRSGTGDIYARRISSGGSPMWTANGVPVSVAAGEQSSPQINEDQAGGAIIVWQDHRSGEDADIYVQRVTLNGDPAWASDGLALCTAPGTQIDPMLVPDGVGGAIVAWADLRNGADLDIYAQRIERAGSFGRPQPHIASVRDVPNDQGGRVKVSWGASYLDAEPVDGITEYRVWRSAPPNAAIPAASASSRVMRRAPSPEAAEIYWEYLVTLPAAQLPGYSFVAPTTGDSVEASNPRTHFMIEAIGPAGHWFSSADSGYSVDNLAPAGPAPFTAKYVHTYVALHWGRSGEADFAFYRMYRGASPDFVPGIGNRITQQSDTGYVDVRLPDQWYKLSAVDAHGNESPFATLGPHEILDTPSGSAVGVWLSAPRPNPMFDRSTIAFGLATGGRTRLTVFDPGGREVRRLVDAMLPAGEHSASWDGSDGRGRRLAGGVYLYRLEVPGRTLRGRVAVIH